MIVNPSNTIITRVYRYSLLFLFFLNNFYFCYSLNGASEQKDNSELN